MKPCIVEITTERELSANYALITARHGVKAINVMKYRF